MGKEAPRGVLGTRIPDNCAAELLAEPPRCGHPPIAAVWLRRSIGYAGLPN